MTPLLTPQWLGRVSYEAGLELQESLVLKKVGGDSAEYLLLLEHDPVYTMGRNRDESSLRDEKQLPHPVFRTNRGGQATYHGPGQRVGYVMLDLQREHGSVRARDLHAYVEGLEEWLIKALDRFNVRGERRAGRVGVWVVDRAAGTEAGWRDGVAARAPEDDFRAG